jgi:hypothetical protein
MAEPNATACPLLGLARDRWTRFQFPERHHRCWAGDPPKKIDLPFQGAMCLTPDFRDCVLHRQWEKSRTASGS